MGAAVVREMDNQSRYHQQYPYHGQCSHFHHSAHQSQYRSDCKRSKYDFSDGTR